MGSVWKRLQRVNKRAAKFQFTASYHELTVVNSTSKWRPSNLSIVWTRRSRRVASTPHPWEPDMIEPLQGRIRWPVPDNNTISVTLFKDPRTHELEDKDWTFVVEDVSSMGKKRVLASAQLNMRKYASELPTQQSFELILKPASRKIVSAKLELTLSCVFLREGKATDEDMQSIVSLLSVNNNHDHDIAPLDDLEDIPDTESNYDLSEHVLDFTAQLEQLTNSLNGSEVATPMSVPSLTEDPTPLAETPHYPELAGARRSYRNSRDMTPLVAAKTPLAFDGPAAAAADATAIKAPSPGAAAAAAAAPTKPTTTASASTAASSTKPTATTTTASATTTTAYKPYERKPKTTSYSFESHNNAKNASKMISGFGSYHAVKETSKPSSSITPETCTTSAPTPIERTSAAAADAKSASETPASRPSISAAATTTPPTASLTTELNTRARAAELPPLNLKKSYEHASAGATKSTLSRNGTLARDRTPGQDLLEWCKEVTADYPGVKVTNLTTSWRNGMAFCAVVHHFQPELIDMSQLTAHDVVGNCRAAFDAAERLGIPRVIEPRDMSMLAVPDKLAVMTYLYQLRSHFTGHQLQLEQIGNTSDESSYVIGNYKSDNHLPAVKLDHLKMMQQTHYNGGGGGAQPQLISALNDGGEMGCLGDDVMLESSSATGAGKKDVKNMLLSGSKHLMGKMAVLRSPSKEKVVEPSSPVAAPAAAKPAILMTRRELNDPFGSDDETEERPTGDGEAERPSQNGAGSEQQQQQQQQRNISKDSPSLDPATTNKLLSRHKEMSAKAKAMMERLNNRGIPTAPAPENGNHSSSSSSSNRQQAAPDTEEERQVRLREHARRLIAETRARSQHLDLPTSPIRMITQRITLSPERSTISPIHHQHAAAAAAAAADGGVFFGDSVVAAEHAAKENSSPSKRLSAAHLFEEAASRRGSPSSLLSGGKLALSERNGNTPLTEQQQRASPQREKKLEQLSYIESELEALEREQESIDLKASALEKKLRGVMGGSGSGENPDADETEEQLLTQWFTLVNKKNALLRRQMQLNILEQENDLERRYAMLNRELRANMSVEDWRKSEAQRERDRLLLDELVAIVDKRNELVQHLHSQEQAIEDDDEIERELEHVDITAKDKCVIQ